MIQNNLKRPQMIPNGLNSSQMIPNVAKWYKNKFKIFQIVLNGSK